MLNARALPGEVHFSIEGFSRPSHVGGRQHTANGSSERHQAPVLVLPHRSVHDISHGECVSCFGDNLQPSLLTLGHIGAMIQVILLQMTSNISFQARTYAT